MINTNLYCKNFEDCPAHKNCARTDYPISVDFEIFDYWKIYGNDDKGYCEYFLCNCYQVVFKGSSKHGNYYKCLICGEEGEG